MNQTSSNYSSVQQQQHRIQLVANDDRSTSTPLKRKHRRSNICRPPDLSQLNLDEPGPLTIGQTPDGYGGTIMEYRIPDGRMKTRVTYDRNFMLAMAFSPLSLVHPNNYFDLYCEMREIIPAFPQRWIPPEFLQEPSTTTQSVSTISQDDQSSKKMDSCNGNKNE